MKIYKGRGLGDFYYDIVRDLLDEGRSVTVRGNRCIEMKHPVVLVYEDPAAHWMYIPGRKFNPFFALAECAWILAGSGDVEWISFYNSNMRKFADEGQKDFHAAYGVRARHWPYPKSNDEGDTFWNEVDQIQTVISKLVGSPTTRQAVMSYWCPVRDNIDISKDYPCNNITYFSLRDGKLDMTQVIRSNDLIWGTPHNAFQWSHVMAYVAGCVGAKLGTLTYFVQNMHFYQDLYPDTLKAVIDQAHLVGNPGAFCMSGFGPLTKQEFEECWYRVNYCAINEPFHFHDSVSSDYWSYWLNFIPYMTWLFSCVKDKINPVAWLGTPYLGRGGYKFLKIVSEFYQDSKSPLARAVAEECERLAGLAGEKRRE